MTESRPNPDALLSSIQREEAARQRGQLKVFLGMCPGVGKTCAMLEAAHAELRSGKDVVAGWIETHGRKETSALAQRIPEVAGYLLEYRGVPMREMDLDALLSRRPALALVDELAHTNTPGSRHPKRWQDVQELLNAGIDVYTTLNIQHVESRADAARQITGAEIRETVPDSILDGAVLELVDLPPRELVQRLKDGKVYLGERAGTASENYFREINLAALRELALRFVADHVGDGTTSLRRSGAGREIWKTGNRLLVAVGSSPSSEPLIRRTRRMADELHCPWIAVHVEGIRPLSDADQARLSANLEAARKLGAEIVTTSDDSLARGLLRVASDRDATQIVLGKPADSGWFARRRGERFLRVLTRESGDVDLHVIRAKSRTLEPLRWKPQTLSGASQYLTALGAVAGTALFNLALTPMTGPRVPGLIFLVAVVMLALFVGRGPVLVAGAASALVWNLFFLPPRFTLTIRQTEDAVLFAVYFLVALVLSQLVARIRAQGEAERRKEERATALYELTREFAESSSRDEIIWHLIAQIDRVFGAPAAVCLPGQDKLSPHPDSSLPVDEKELGVSDWAFRHNQPAGKFTDNLPGASALHLPLSTDRKALGVLAVQFNRESLMLSQRDLLGAFARQAALVLDRLALRAAAEQSRLLAESEKLSRTILNSISHELRTPLSASSSAASALAEADDASLEHRRLLVAEIQEANARLNRIVGNLLDVARLESSKIVPRLDWHDLRDVMHSTVRELQRELAGHPVTLHSPGKPVLTRLEFTLTQHALANLLVNAATHTPAGTPIEVRTQVENGTVLVSVLDEGPGIAPELLPRIFDKFFRSPNAPAGGSGLGLTIAKGFVEAQGGTISAANRPGGGSIFSLRLPKRETPPPQKPHE